MLTGVVSVVGLARLSDVLVCVGCVFANLLQKVNYQEFLNQAGRADVMNYLVSDFIVQIKNAYLANRKVVTTRYSKLTFAIGQLLVKNRLLSEVKEETMDGKRMIVATLRYVRRKPSLHKLEIISKPSLRVYVGTDDLKKLRREDALSVLSTSKGVMTGMDAIKGNTGGEYLFKVW